MDILLGSEFYHTTDNPQPRVRRQELGYCRSSIVLSDPLFVILLDRNMVGNKI